MQKEIDENTAQTTMLTDRTDTMQADLDDLNTRLSAIENSIASIEATSSNLAEINASVNATKKEIKELKRRVSIAAAARKATLKVKVLSGDDNLVTAKKAAKRLEGKGFSVRIVDFTPEPKFKHNIVYYAKGFKYEAKEISRIMGKRTDLRKLTWNSVFDIIVVTAGM